MWARRPRVGSNHFRLDAVGNAVEQVFDSSLDIPESCRECSKSLQTIIWESLPHVVVNHATQRLTSSRLKPMSITDWTVSSDGVATPGSAAGVVG